MTLDHLVREPAGEPEGALILNHGRGTDERDLYDLLEVLDPGQRLLGITPGAPLTNIPPGGRHWYVVPRVGYPDPETFHRSYELLTGFLDETLEARGIGWDRAVIGGFSMGTVMSYAVGLGEGRPSPAGILATGCLHPSRWRRGHLRTTLRRRRHGPADRGCRLAWVGWGRRRLVRR